MLTHSATPHGRRDETLRDFARRRFDELYRRGADPWSYASTDEEQERYGHVLDLIDRSTGESRPEALEVGCGEGFFTSRLMTKCGWLLAVDISEVALSRAQERCGAEPVVTFAQWNAREDPPLGPFGLVVCMDVIDEISRPMAQRKAARTVTRCVAPGGNLIVSAVIQDPVIENARWARFMGRGGQWVIDHFASRPNLTQVELRETERHLIALYQAVEPG